MKHIVTFLTVLALAIYAVNSQPKPTDSETIKSALIEKQKLKETSLVKNVPFSSIGPTIMSGRVVDLDVNPNNPIEFYVAYASGGVWHTTNNGTTFTAILDNSSTQNVGDIAVHWDTRTIWVGTGENNASRSSYAGIGVLKSSDNGKNWKNVGLSDSHHIGRILINPTNPDEVVIGVTGHLYSSSTARGIYKTNDGGKTWQHTLFIDEKSGIIDVQYVPENYNIMYASSWTKNRKAWHFDGSGSNSAIYKSIDAGKTWQRISTDNSGFPMGEGVGRIGLAVYDRDVIYAVIDNQSRRKKVKSKEVKSEIDKNDFKTMTIEMFVVLDDNKLETFLRKNGFQEKYTSSYIKELVLNKKVKPIDIANYLEDANALLFDTEVVGAEVYRSLDGGTTWHKTHTEYLDDLFYSYGYYFGRIHVSPANSQHLYIYGVPILKSKDGGKSFTSINAENVHVDHHALWINTNNPNHLIIGNDGGVNITYDDGENWIKNNSPPVGQFYTINVDSQSPYNVYGGLQDNGVWVGPNDAVENKGWHQEGKYPWETILGGDGMQIAIDSRDSNLVYAGYQFGNYYRINRATGELKPFKIKHELGESPYRFNWQSPILLSPHNQDIVYFGGNKLLRSMDKGNNWEAISPDLTNGGKSGNVAYATLTAISESPFEFGLLYTGSDDGLVYRTEDGGNTWDILSNTLPRDLWVSRIVASRHKKERVYLTLNGYRWDNFLSYVYVSNDYGNTWETIGEAIPASPVNVIIEDPENEKLLYLGSDNGAYISFNQGESWHLFSNGLPPVAVHDMVIQESDGDLLLGTHGRSIYKTNIRVLQSKLDFSEDIVLFEPHPVNFSKNWGNSWNIWLKPITPSTVLKFYSNSKTDLILYIKSEKGKVINTIDVKAQRGFNYVDYNLTLPKKGRKILLKENDNLKTEKAKDGNYYLPKGSYIIELKSKHVPLQIK